MRPLDAAPPDFVADLNVGIAGEQLDRGAPAEALAHLGLVTTAPATPA